MDLTSRGSIIQTPFCMRPLIEFLQALVLVEMWKYFVFLSPSLSQRSLDFCRHIDSLFLRAVQSSLETSFLSSILISFKPCCAHRLSKYSTFSENLTIFSSMFPKVSRFHLLRKDLNLFNLTLRQKPAEPTTFSFFHSFSTAEEKLLFENQQSSTLKGLQPQSEE